MCDHLKGLSECQQGLWVCGRGPEGFFTFKIGGRQPRNVLFYFSLYLERASLVTWNHLASSTLTQRKMLVKTCSTIHVANTWPFLSSSDKSLEKLCLQVHFSFLCNLPRPRSQIFVPWSHTFSVYLSPCIETAYWSLPPMGLGRLGQRLDMYAAGPHAGHPWDPQNLWVGIITCYASIFLQCSETFNLWKILTSFHRLFIISIIIILLFMDDKF